MAEPGLANMKLPWLPSSWSEVKDQVKQGLVDALRGQPGSGRRLGAIVGEDLVTGKLRPWAPFTDPLPDPNDPEATARRALGLATFAMGGLGLAPKGSIGVFGGRMAATADKAALKQAEEMWGRGAPKEEIIDKTGWFPGPDGQWKFEIPDNNSRFKYDPGKAENLQSRTHAGPVSGVFEHPELKNAYPDSLNPNLVFTGEYGGSYNPTTIRVSNNQFAPSTPRSVLLHELQHGIQEKEGFARGANSQAIYRDLPQTTSNSVVEQMRSALERGDYGQPGDQPWHKAAKSFLELERQVKQQQAEDLYRRSAGEVEARAVQSRMDLTPEQRRARYPWLDYDVPVEQQIVK